MHFLMSIYHFIVRAILLTIFCLTGGCAAVGALSAVGQVTNAALEMSGLKKPDLPEVPDAQKPPRNVSLKLHAGVNLNSDAAGRPLALVVRLYKLRQLQNFEQASYDTFLNPQREKEAIGADLVEVREITLVPGQKYEINEKVSKEANFLAIVALFRNPAPQRWKIVFPATEAEKLGVTVGLHACAITIGNGATASENSMANKFLAPVRCQ